MKIVRINPLRPDPRLIREAALVLKRGGLVVYPTETAYALGCDAKNARAMRRIRTVKGREKSKPLPLIAASLSMATRLANFDVFSLALAKKHWPGPLTLILPVPRKFTTVNFPDMSASTRRMLFRLRSVLQRFRDVGDLDALASGEVGDRARDLKRAVDRARRELQGFRRFA